MITILFRKGRSFTIEIGPKSGHLNYKILDTKSDVLLRPSLANSSAAEFASLGTLEMEKAHSEMESRILSIISRNFQGQMEPAVQLRTDPRITFYNTPKSLNYSHLLHLLSESMQLSFKAEQPGSGLAKEESEAPQ